MEYKFRAFHPQSGQMLPWKFLQAREHIWIPVKLNVSDFRLNHSAVESVARWDYVGPIPFDHPDFIFMQYIGKKDKTGKEMFAGDIITWEGWRRIVVWDNMKSMYVFTNNINKDEDFPLYDYFEAKFKVIGNVHEDSDMIT